MGYPLKLLNPGEQVAVDVGPHWKYLALPGLAVLLVIAGAVAALAAQVPRWAELAIAGVMVASLLWLAVRYVRWATTSFVATNQRLIMRRGVLRRTGREILLDRLADITYRQTLTDRLLGCGDILLESPGRQGQEVLVDLPHAVRIQNEICRLVNQRQGVVGPNGGWRVATAPALRQNRYRWQKPEDENDCKSTHKDAPFYRDSNAVWCRVQAEGFRRRYTARIGCAPNRHP